MNEENIDIEVEITKNILLGKTCDNCSNCNNYGDKCQKPEKLKYNTCIDWVKSEIASMMFPIIRKVFPTLISNDIVSVQPMAKQSDNIFYLKPTKKARKRKKNKDIMDQIDLPSLPKQYQDNIKKLLENQKIEMEKNNGSNNSSK